MVASSPFCKHFNNDHSWNSRDTTVPVSCQWLKRDFNQDHMKLQALSYALHISFALYYVSVYKEKRQTVYAIIFALNVSCIMPET